MTKLLKRKNYSLLDNKGYIAGSFNNLESREIFSLVLYGTAYKNGSVLFTDKCNMRNKVISVKNRVYGKTAETVGFTGDNTIISLRNSLKSIGVSFVTDKVNNINIFIQKKMLANLRKS